jgi:hypothetical protein
METVLTRLRDAGLKVNAAKSLFCAHEIEYLGYILTREGIKPQPKKVQAILALNPPTNIKELRHFLGMVLSLGFGYTLCTQSRRLHVLTRDMIWCLLKKIHEFLPCASKSEKPSQSQNSLDGLTEPTVG